MHTIHFFLKHGPFLFPLFFSPPFNSLTWFYSLSVTLSQCSPPFHLHFLQKLNHFHFYTCVWWGNYRLLNRAWPLKTHTYTDTLFLSSHRAAVCEIKSIPPATWLPSKSDPTITTATSTHMHTHTLANVQKTSAIAGCHFLPAFIPPSFFFSLFSLPNPSQSPLYPNTQRWICCQIKD